MRKDNFSEPETLFFLQSRACLMGWSATEKEELQHLISESHNGSAQKKKIFRIAKNCAFAATTQAKPQPLAASPERE
jgi:hypothetical protein